MIIVHDKKYYKILYCPYRARFQGLYFPTQGVAIGLYYVAPSGHRGKKQAESLIYSSPG
ncbi:hypothetical protein [Dysgonomonas reticulitermitis]